MKMLKGIILFFFCWGINITLAQVQEGKITITYEKGIESIIDQYLENAKTNKVKGYRVQLCSESGNDAKKNSQCN